MFSVSAKNGLIKKCCSIKRHRVSSVGLTFSDLSDTEFILVSA